MLKFYKKIKTNKMGEFVKDKWKMEVIDKIEHLQDRIDEIWGQSFAKSWRKDLDKIKNKYIYTPISYGELHDDILELKEWARIAETELDKKETDKI